MKKTIVALLMILQLAGSFAQEKLTYFLPSDVNYNPRIPAPDQFFRMELGEWHLTHAQVVSYLQEIARVSDRAILYEYARSYENRPLVHLVFTSPENQENLGALKARHVAWSEPDNDLSPEGVPLVVCLTYGVHGNESSGSNSSVLTAYYLAAAEGEALDKLLASTVVIVDPCLNPDGFTRHSTWANMHQSAVANGDQNSRQFSEVWPRGRTNHYWFDLNRDYLLLVNPESRGRIQKFHEWRPNVVTDHHESSPDFTFFFQPGVPERSNPLTPEKNYTLTAKFASYHARYLDEIGSDYFSEEVFDDYYFGKGSSYPDIHGGIGILFEQASIRGRIRETSHGPKTLSQAMKNQFTVSLSTLSASVDLRDDLLSYQREFYTDALTLAENSVVKAYVFGSADDRIKTRKFVDVLNRHQIEVFPHKENEDSFIVPVHQKQYRLLTSIFEEVHRFPDTAFYDVSTWTFPHAYDLPLTRVLSLNELQISERPAGKEHLEGQLYGGENPVAYLFRWNEYASPGVLYSLQDAGLITRVATKAATFEIEDKEEGFQPGSILIPVNTQEMARGAVRDLLTTLARESGIDFFGLSTGLSVSGIDVGSSSFSRLYRPEVLIFTGGGVSSYWAGEIWHLFDQDFSIPLTLGMVDRLGSMDLDRYNRIILPAGSYLEWGEFEVTKLRTWTEEGGILIACGSAGSWAAKHQLGKTAYKEALEPDSTRYLKYSQRREESDLQGISGVILKAQLDISHPLCYGYLKEDLALFKRGTTVAAPLGMKYAEPVKFASEPYLSGWVSPANLERIKEAPVVSVQSIGRGKLITYHESMNFRGYWLGTHKLFMNSIFFGSVIR